MEITAERLTPKDATISPLVHQYRTVYNYAENLVADKVVFEAGCGEGYGTSILAGKAKKIVAIDNSEKAIKAAKAAFAADNVDFICSSIEKFDMKPGVFDVVCSFQAIEHLRDPRRLLLKAADALKPDGIFIVSTPNKKTSMVDNPYHMREYDKDEFAALLKKYFREISIYGVQASERAFTYREKRRRAARQLRRLDPFNLQTLIPRLIRQKLFDFVAGKFNANIYSDDKRLAEGIGSEDYRISGENIDSALDLMAVCRGKNLII